MRTFELDETNTYPSEDTLKSIERCYSEYNDLFDFIKDYFKNYGQYSKTVDEVGTIYELRTCGWSGCEDIVGAMKLNTIFWLSTWYESRRGGYFKFIVPPQLANKNPLPNQ